MTGLHKYRAKTKWPNFGEFSFFSAEIQNLAMTTTAHYGQPHLPGHVYYPQPPPHAYHSQPPPGSYPAGGYGAGWADPDPYGYAAYNTVSTCSIL